MSEDIDGYEEWLRLMVGTWEAIKIVVVRVVRALLPFVRYLQQAGLLSPSKPRAHRKRRSHRRMLAYARQRARMGG